MDLFSHREAHLTDVPRWDKSETLSSDSWSYELAVSWKEREFCSNELTEASEVWFEYREWERVLSEAYHDNAPSTI